MSVVAVIVSYHPQLHAIRALLDTLLPQVKAVVVVDNGSDKKFNRWLIQNFPNDVHGIFFKSNNGIAAAQNAGIDWARRQGAEYVMLFDQDSLPAPDMVHHLVEAMREKLIEGCNVAAVGPRYLDERQNNPPPFIRIQGIRLKRQACDNSSSIIEVDYLISSGSLIPIPVFDEIGVMHEDLFIDYVDIEWGLRAKVKGFQSYGVCSAKMKHQLGENPVLFYGRQIPLHNAIRHYYHFRNAIWLYRQKWVPVNWKFVDGRKLFLKYVFYSIFAKPRWAHTRSMTLGIWHGLWGRMGPAP
jgi:rhamnosyltransferase